MVTDAEVSCPRSHSWQGPETRLLTRLGLRFAKPCTFTCLYRNKEKHMSSVCFKGSAPLTLRFKS